MNWIVLEAQLQLDALVEKSFERAQVIFKHSTTCSISNMVLNRLQREELLPDADFYYLDLLAYRFLSNAVAERFAVEHESPQILIIKEGKCIYHESHYAVMMYEIAERV